MNTEMLIMLSAIVDKMEIKNELGDIDGKTQEELGTKVAISFVTSLHKAKDEVYEFIALYKECTTEEAKKVDIVAVVKELLGTVGIKGFLA